MENTTRRTRARLTATAVLVAAVSAASVTIATPGFAQTTTPTTTITPTTTTKPTKSTTIGASGSSPSALTYAAPGPHAVGYRVFAISTRHSRTLTVRAWYPIAAPIVRARSIRYIAANKFGAKILPVDHITSTGEAVRDAPPDHHAGRFPLIVFSHGFGMSPIMYSALIEHYVSRGFVVLAPEHADRFLDSFPVLWKALIDRPDDVTRTVDLAERLTKPTGALAGVIDTSRVAVVGHSYGGYTALAAAGARFDLTAHKARCAALAADDELQFFCGPVLAREADMAKRAGLSSVPRGLWPSVGDRRITAAISLAGDAYLFNENGLGELKVPLMAVGGTVDVGTPYPWGVKLAYDRAGSPEKSLVTFNGAGHYVSVDPCDNLPWTQKFSYAEVFCNDAVWGTKRPLDIVGHYTTAFLLDALTGDSAAHAELAASPARQGTIEFTSTGL